MPVTSESMTLRAGRHAGLRGLERGRTGHEKELSREVAVANGGCTPDLPRFARVDGSGKRELV